MTVREQLIEAGYEDVVIFENYSYDDAFVGVSHDGRAVYDYDKMIKWLVDTQGFSWEDAVEWVDYNTLRSLPYYEEAPIVLYGMGVYKKILDRESYARTYYANRRDYRKSNGLCVDCGVKLPAGNKTLQCASCREKSKERCKRYQMKSVLREGKK